MVSSLTFAAATAAAALATVSAHQTVYIPAPTFTTTDKTTKTNPIAFLENQGFKPNDDVAGYMKSKGYKTLREFMDNKANYKTDAAGATFECGYTDPNGARQPIPANGMMRSSGFTHEGPCEVWIDDTRVLGSATGNCNKDIPGQPVSYKVDFSVCKGDCLIRWYWLGKRLIGSKWSWQVYKECIPIRAGGGARQRSIDDGDDFEEAPESYRMYNTTEEATPEEPTASVRTYEDEGDEELVSYRMDGGAEEEESTESVRSNEDEGDEELVSYRMDGGDDEEAAAPSDSN